jgi:hypothetical protein
VCFQQTALPAGGDASLQPWTRQDLDGLGETVSLTCDMFCAAASELQRQVQRVPKPLQHVKRLLAARGDLLYCTCLCISLQLRHKLESLWTAASSRRGTSGK